jgi:glycosyltransferase involved in cell wall biosynthesis
MSDPEQPFFSIIIPTYNVARCVAVALESVINQSFKNYECLIMDGMSTDGTLEILKAYKETCSNLKIYSESDKGVYDAMNKGIDKAKGRFIYFMGADDYLLDADVLKRVKDVADSNTTDILYGNVNSPVLGDNYAGEFEAQRLIYMNICHQSIFYRNTVFKTVGNFNTKYRIHSDWDHNLHWFFHPQITATYLEESIAYYDGNGLSAKQKDHAFRKDYIRLVYNYASRKHNKLSITRMLFRGFLERI